MPESAATARPETVIPNRDLLALSLIIVFGIFATTMAQPDVLGRLPLQFLLKNEIHVSLDYFISPRDLARRFSTFRRTVCISLNKGLGIWACLVVGFRFWPRSFTAS